MTKSEQRECDKLAAARAYGLGDDYVARILSALIRAARTERSRTALLAAAQREGVISSPEFII